MSLRKVFESAEFAQVAMVVEDIEAVKKLWASVLGVEVPPTNPCGDYAVTQTTVFGEPAPLADSKLAFFTLVPGVQLELIEPNKEHSVWRDEMDKKGEGLHHIAFTVKDADEAAKILIEDYDAVIEQAGNYGDGTGKYIYLSLHKDLKCRIELLENF